MAIIQQQTTTWYIKFKYLLKNQINYTHSILFYVNCDDYRADKTISN